jgi:hypothetical protein
MKLKYILITIISIGSCGNEYYDISEINNKVRSEKNLSWSLLAIQLVNPNYKNVIYIMNILVLFGRGI